MKSVLGRYLKTLLYQVEKEIKESLYKNDAFIESQWSFLERSIVLWSSQYKKYVILIFTLALLIVTSIIVSQPFIKSYALPYFPNWRILLEWQSVFLGGQLTIVGVVYPLVVGLISVLFQNKSAKKTIFPIYQKYSGFMFAGLSGLALSFFIIWGYFFRVSLSDSGYAAFCITSAIWLSFNILLTAWFFVQTFRMLDDSSRDRLVLRYSIHETCKTDVRERIKQLLLQNAVEHKLLVNPNKNILDVHTHNYSDSGYVELSCNFDSEAALKNVRFWLVNLAIHIQVVILKFIGTKNANLVIQVFRSNDDKKRVCVAKYSGFNMNKIVRILIKSAFSFKRENGVTEVGITAVLNGFLGPANDAIRGGDAKEFSDAVANLVNWHTEIAEALSFKNDNNSADNWLLLPASSFWSRSYLDELLGEYHRLAREAVEKIPENSRYYNEMIYLHKRVFSKRNDLVDKEVRSLIQGSYYMWYLLIEWRSYSSDSSDMRIANKYEDIVLDFVGAWESWLMYIEPRTSRKYDVDKAYPAFVTHLEFTASTAISALRFNNYEAAGWGVDILNNWFEKLTYSDHWEAEYHWHSVLLNHCYLPKSQTAPEWQVILKGTEYGYEYKDAFELSFKNTHLDLRVITACYMLLKPGVEKHHLLVKYVNSLLLGKSIHPTGGVGRPCSSVDSAGELLGLYIRHRDYPNYGEGEYGTWLSSILESFGRIYEDRKVSGRVYSGWGANDPRSMNKAYVEIAMSLSTRVWNLPEKWSEAIYTDAFRYMDRGSIVSDLRDWISIANEDGDYLLVDYEQKEILKANFIDSLEAVINKINQTQRQLVADADVDQDRLSSFGVSCSKAFYGPGQKFPVSLFETVSLDSDVDDEFSHEVNIANYMKESIALGVDTNRAINEDDWLADAIGSDLKNNAFRALIRKTPSDVYKYSSIEAVLLDILDMTKLLACPIIFVGNQELLNTLRRAPYDRELIDRYNISRQDGYVSEYVCHVGRCEVHTLRFRDVDFSLLTSKELFHHISFKKIAEGQHVLSDFELNEGSDTVGKLRLKYWMKIDLLNDTPCIRLDN